MKKTILVFALSRTPWIGGIYYKKNITAMLLSSVKITQKYNIAVIVNEQNKGIFECFKDRISIISCPSGIGVVRALWYCIKCSFSLNVKYVFPIKPYFPLILMRIVPVSWIADFQHIHYPEFFEKDELDKRNSDFSFIAKKANPLVLSSNDSRNDFQNNFSRNRKNVFVVHFTSNINDELERITEHFTEEILEKFGLTNKKYIIICNQFWKHKNHIIVFKAIKLLCEKNMCRDFRFVFTGEPSDRRNPEYYEELKTYMQNSQVASVIDVLGFIDRAEQLCLIKNAEFVIQPSLFEGWGTVLEDAKVLKKDVILSDIPVHREQMNSHCDLFDPCNASELAEKISKKTEVDALSSDYPEDSTKEYVKALEDIFV